MSAIPSGSCRLGSPGTDRRPLHVDASPRVPADRTREPSSASPLRYALLVALAFAVLATLLAGRALCASAPATMKLILLRHPFVAEVARTEAERERGLMYRKSLPPDRGMLFIFPAESIEYFWMKNTLIPLDVAFMDSKGTILTIKTMKPLDETPVSSEKPCKYALEMNAGYFAKIGAKPGDAIKGIDFSLAGE